jgi:hypothetical protein
MKFKVSKDSYVGLGHSQIWALSDKHPFHNCGVIHDDAYEKHTDRKVLANADKVFLNCCLKVAEDFTGIKRKYYQSQAYLFYGIVVVFRTLFR